MTVGDAMEYARSIAITNESPNYTPGAGIEDR
jgi:hypothetical protein